MYMSSLLLLSVYVHVIYILSGHICITCTLSEVVLDIFLPNRQYQCHPYIISSTLYIFYYVQLSFCTLSIQMHIVHVICMLSTHVHIICLSSLKTPHIPYYPQLSFRTLTTHMHIVHVICMLSAPVHIICLSSLTLLIYPIIHNLVSIHIVSTNAHCRYHLYIVCRCICYVHFLISTAIICICCLHKRTLSISFACCPHMSSAYYLSICVLCAHYLQWSLIYSFQTDNAIFEICQFLTIPGPFEYFSENGWSQKIKVFSMKERSLPPLLV